ncbi:hypothetical protein E2C01_066087 [Portunus trituberculatus]|uniref:Uncharacterized protein n=1 Tax=Portunus trituberculatus TaxID=210409 RepID=A0A5B7HRC7_PORTR|nr:hypothetical protein [Portunus trituberculatus]
MTSCNNNNNNSKTRKKKTKKKKKKTNTNNNNITNNKRFITLKKSVTSHVTGEGAPRYTYSGFYLLTASHVPWSSLVFPRVVIIESKEARLGIG